MTLFFGWVRLAWGLVVMVRIDLFAQGKSLHGALNVLWLVYDAQNCIFLALDEWMKCWNECGERLVVNGGT